MKDLFFKFKNAKDENARKEIASLPECPIEILSIIINHDTAPNVLREAIDNPKTTNDLKLIGEDRYKKLLEEYSERKYWYDLLNNAKYFIDRIKIVESIECPIWVLEIVTTHDTSYQVVEAAIKNPNITDDLKLQGEIRLATMKEKNNPTICPIPWNHLEIQPNGDFRICCMCIHEPFGKLKKEDNKTIANIKNTTLTEARNLPLIKELRQDMLNGKKNKMCNQCWDSEKLGLPSKRLHMLNIYTEKFDCTDIDGQLDTEKFPIKYLDLRFGNLCNLTCRSCGPTESSLWVEDFHKLSGKEISTMKHYKNKEYQIGKINNKIKILNDDGDFTWYENEKFWKEFKDHENFIDRLYFTGGEPTINKSHYRLLEYLIQNGYSKKIKLEYNSNMVSIPEKLYTWWEEFESVGIGCSIDGMNEYANYIRPPSQWEVLEKNLDRLGYSGSKKINSVISTTVSVFNILHVFDLIKWCLSKKYTNIERFIKISMLEGPKHLSVKTLPYAQKLIISEKYNEFFEEIKKLYGDSDYWMCKRIYSGAVNFMLSEDFSDELPNLKKSITSIDGLKNQSLEKTIPWLYDILK